MKHPALLVAAGIVALSASAAPAAADQLIACRGNQANVSSVAVDNLRFGVEAAYVWASANLHLMMRDGRVREYKLSGRAQPTDKTARLNSAQAGFSYPGFTCTVQYGAIISVRNCNGVRKQRSCDIGVSMFGLPVVYAVSMTAEPSRVIAAATMP